MVNLVITPKIMEKAIKKNGLPAMLEVLPKRTRYHLTHEAHYGKEKENA